MTLKGQITGVRQVEGEGIEVSGTTTPVIVAGAGHHWTPDPFTLVLPDRFAKSYSLGREITITIEPRG